jgi:hypothetical protein
MNIAVNEDCFLENMINKLVFVMVKCSVFSAVRTELLNIIQTSFGFRGINDDRPTLNWE